MGSFPSPQCWCLLVNTVCVLAGIALEHTGCGVAGAVLESTEFAPDCIGRTGTLWGN